MISETITKQAIRAFESGRVPDSIVRWGIRRACKQRLTEFSNLTNVEQAASKDQFVEAMKQSPIALVPELANDQHYELPPEFFGKVLGAHRKYSCCYWDKDTTSLTQAEENALRQTVEHADIQNGQHILELGCGWGSLTLWMAQQFPDCNITAVSNSAPQRRFITELATQRGLTNVEVITCDLNTFDPPRKYDRVVSVEMFEHMRNYQELLHRIASWLTVDGKLFVHIFCHAQYAYPYESQRQDDWMSRYFFSGGMMPSDDLLFRFQEDLSVSNHWRWQGGHYQKTSEAWLQNFDRNQKDIHGLFVRVYGHSQANIWVARWRMFFLACAELFGYRQGQEWWVSHYLLEQDPVSRSQLQASPESSDGP